MRYDETSNWGTEDEQTDEAEFQELRKRLQNLQKTVAAADQNLYIEVLSNLVANTFQSLDQQGSQMDWRDLDLALHEMYLFGELALPNQGFGSKNAPSTAASERLVVMMQKMVESGRNFPVVPHCGRATMLTLARNRQLSTSRNSATVHGDMRPLLRRVRGAAATYPSGP
jgi:hypothetical protein